MGVPYPIGSDLIDHKFKINDLKVSLLKKSEKYLMRVYRVFYPTVERTYTAGSEMRGNKARPCHTISHAPYRFLWNVLCGAILVHRLISCQIPLLNKNIVLWKYLIKSDRVTRSPMTYYELSVSL